MQAVTLLFALIATVAIFCSKPIYSLIVYIAALAWYPSYLAVSLGTIDFTLRRMVIIVILTHLFLRTSLLKHFKFVWLDKIVIIYFCCQVLAGAITTPSLMALLENRAGAVFDMVLPYFAVRIIIRNKQQFVTLLRGILMIAMPLAILGLYQSITGTNPVGFLMKYHVWGTTEISKSIRFGFWRANATFPEEIMFGLFFAMLGPVCAGVIHNVKRHKILCWVGLGLMGVGVFSSMSSGPMLAALLSILFIGFFRWRKYWKPVTIIIIVLCGSVEIMSNRHFYDVLGAFTLSPATAWYRSRLIEVALFEGGMSAHWLVGYGAFADPGWGPAIDGRNHTDAVNHYILVLARYGLAGLVPFLAMCTIAIKKLVDAHRASVFDSDKWLIWCLSAALFGLGASFVSVSLFGSPTSLFYIMLGLCGAMPIIVSRPDSLRLECV